MKGNLLDRVLRAARVLHSARANAEEKNRAGRMLYEAELEKKPAAAFPLAFRILRETGTTNDDAGVKFWAANLVRRTSSNIGLSSTEADKGNDAKVFEQCVMFAVRRGGQYPRAEAQLNAAAADILVRSGGDDPTGLLVRALASTNLPCIETTMRICTCACEAKETTMCGRLQSLIHALASLALLEASSPPANLPRNLCASRGDRGATPRDVALKMLAVSGIPGMLRSTAAVPLVRVVIASMKSSADACDALTRSLDASTTTTYDNGGGGITDQARATVRSILDGIAAAMRVELRPSVARVGAALARWSVALASASGFERPIANALMAVLSVSNASVAVVEIALDALLKAS
eukprot:g3381.t1